MYATIDSLGITPVARTRHDAELCARLREAGGPVFLRRLFDGFRPVWAADAAERLLQAGKLVVVPDRGLWFAGEPVPPPRPAPEPEQVEDS